MSRMNFTKKAIECLECPETKKTGVYFRDTRVQGLALRVSPSGRKVFVLYRKIHGKPERINIGAYPATTIEMARGRAAELNSLIAKGENPTLSADGRVFATMPFGALFARFMENHAKIRKRTWKNDQHTYNKHLKRWANRNLDTIHKGDVQALHAKIGNASGETTANRTVALLSKIFSLARDWGYEGDNPATGIRKFKEASRSRFLNATELERFFEALEEHPDPLFADLFRVALMTGARRSNVQAMRWDEIDFDQAVWTIPAAKTKTTEVYRVPLVREAVALLERRRREGQAGGVWVFPSPRKVGQHIEEARYAWAKICERARLKDLRIHDLRRTLGSWQAATGSSLPIIGRALGHTSPAATQIYARLDLDPVRRSMEAAANAMLEASGRPRPAAEVVDVAANE